jgi:hypothetical protein
MLDQMMLNEPVELSDHELDLIGAGQNTQAGRGLVVVGAQIGDVTISEVAKNVAVLSNGVSIPIGVAVAVLSGATGAGVLSQL